MTAAGLQSREAFDRLGNRNPEVGLPLPLFRPDLAASCLHTGTAVRARVVEASLLLAQITAELHRGTQHGSILAHPTLCPPSLLCPHGVPSSLLPLLKSRCPPTAPPPPPPPWSQDCLQAGPGLRPQAHSNSPAQPRSTAITSPAFPVLFLMPGTATSQSLLAQSWQISNYLRGSPPPEDCAWCLGPLPPGLGAQVVLGRDPAEAFKSHNAAVPPRAPWGPGW